MGELLLERAAVFERDTQLRIVDDSHRAVDDPRIPKFEALRLELLTDLIHRIVVDLHPLAMPQIRRPISAHHELIKEVDPTLDVPDPIARIDPTHLLDIRLERRLVAE